MPDRTPAHPDQAPSSQSIADVRLAVSRLGARARIILLSQRLLTLAAASLTVLATLGLLDYFMRFPSWLRGGLLAIGVGAVVLFMRRCVAPAWRFRPSPTMTALRLEQQHEELQGLLASAIDFAHETATPRDTVQSSPIAEALSSRVKREAAHRWRRSDTHAVLRYSQALRPAAALLVIAAALAVFTVAQPALTGIGAVRALAPWANLKWPKRTHVVSATTISVHPLGASLPLRAALVRSNHAPERTDVTVRYRALVDGQPGPTKHALLTWQERRIQTAGDERKQQATGELFERLIEVEGDEVEYRFETLDDQSPWRRIALIEPPQVLSARAIITPPDYALTSAPADGADQSYSQETAIELGAGRDERAVAPRSLAGSRITMTIDLNKPIPVSPDDPAWLRATFGPDTGAGLSLTPSEDGAHWLLDWTLMDSVRVPVSLVDSFGVTSVDEAVYRFEAVQDRPPSATVTAPSADTSVLSTAVIETQGEGRDDVGLDAVWLDRQRFRPAGAPGREPSGPGGALEPIDENPIEMIRIDAQGAVAAVAQKTLDLSTLGLRPGDELWLTAVAEDIFASGADERTPTRSTVRKLRVISEVEFIEQIQRELAAVRQSAIRIHDQQRQLREQAQSRGPETAVRRDQARISERIARQRTSIQRLLQRARSNGLADQTFEGMLSDAGGLLDDAGAWSVKAASRLDDAAEKANNQDAGSAGKTKPGDASKLQPSQAKKETEQGKASAENGRRAAQGDQQSSSSPSDAVKGASREQGAKAADAAKSKASRSQQSGQPSNQQDSKKNDKQAGQQGGQQGGQQNNQQGAERSGDQRDKQAQDEPPTMDKQSAKAVDHAQKQVEEELESLIGLLDRGEDAWVVRRKLEGMLDEQRALHESTSKAGAGTAGRDVKALNERELSELERIVQKQLDLADRAQRLAQELGKRSKQLKDKDPTAAAGMAEAARTASEGQMSEAMKQAAKRAKGNQMAQAGKSQQQAIEQLQEMLEDLDRADRAREEILSRILASLIQSLESLIELQKEALASLENAHKQNDFAGLDADMIHLNQNTLGVLDQAKGAGHELAAVADVIGRAVEAQTRAIIALRKVEVDAAAAQEHEQLSLKLLQEARDKASKAADKMKRQSQEKKRRQLRQQYRQLLEQQVAIRADTDPYAQVDQLSRRDRAAVRALGERQGGVRDALRELVKQTEELSEAGVFKFVHNKLDDFTDEATQTLKDASPEPAIPLQDSSVAMLQSLVEALRESKKKDDDFNQQQQSQGGGKGSGGSKKEQKTIPPLAELRLLRQLQVGLAGRTRAAAEKQGRAQAARRLGAEQRELGDLGSDLIRRMTQSKPGQKPPK